MPRPPHQWDRALDRGIADTVEMWLGTVVPVAVVLGAMAFGARWAVGHPLDAAVPLGAALGSFLLAVLLGLQLLRRGDHARLRHEPAALGTVLVDQQPCAATLLAVDRSRRWRWLPLLTALGANGASTIALALGDGGVTEGSAAAVAGLGVVVLAATGWLCWATLAEPQSWFTRRLGRSRLVDLALLAEGVLVDGELMGWESIEHVVPVGDSLDLQRTRLDWPVLELHGTVAGQPRLWRLRADGHLVHPVTLLAMVTTYRRRPQLREELGTRASVERSRSLTA